MLKIMERVADRFLALVVPHATAAAACAPREVLCWCNAAGAAYKVCHYIPGTCTPDDCTTCYIRRNYC